MLPQAGLMLLLLQIFLFLLFDFFMKTRRIRHLFSSVIVLLISGLSLTAQTVEDFIREYKIQYSLHFKEWSDTSLVLIPVLENLYEQEELWDSITVFERRDRFFDYLTPPVFAYDEAVCLETLDYYRFPEGLLFYKQDKKGERDRRGSRLVGPLNKHGWYYEDIILPLIDYLKAEPVEYIFWVLNLAPLYHLNHEHFYFTIEENRLNVIILDAENRRFQKQDAIVFFNDIRNLSFFRCWFEDSEE